MIISGAARARRKHSFQVFQSRRFKDLAEDLLSILAAGHRGQAHSVPPAPFLLFCRIVLALNGIIPPSTFLFFNCTPISGISRIAFRFFAPFVGFRGLTPRSNEFRMGIKTRIIFHLSRSLTSKAAAGAALFGYAVIISESMPSFYYLLFNYGASYLLTVSSLLKHVCGGRGCRARASPPYLYGGKH